MSAYNDTERREEQGIVEKKPQLDVADQAMSEVIKKITTSGQPRKTTTVKPTIYDTELGHERVPLEPRPPAQPYKLEPRDSLPVKRVEDTERKEEVPTRELPDVPTPELRFSKRTPTKPTRRLVVDTERPEEAVGVEEKPVSPRSVADTAMKRFIGEVKGREVVVDKSLYNVITIDTERGEEIVSIEKRPNIDRSAEAIGMYEGMFTGITRPMREAAIGFRAEAGRREDPYSKFVWSTVGLGLRAGGSAFEAFTMPVRPILITKTVGSTAKLVTDPEYRGEVAKVIMSDPLGTLADIGGGFVGGWALGKTIGYVRTRRLESFLDEYPAEDFYVKEELGMQYPETEIVHEQSFVGFRTPEKTIVDTTSSAKFGEIVEELTPETGWRPSQVSAASDEAIAQAKIAKAILDKARADRMAQMTGGDALVPSLSLEDGGLISTVYHPTFFKRFNVGEIHIPGTSINLPKFKPRFTDLSAPLGTAGAVSSILRTDIKTEDKIREIKMAKQQPRQLREPTPPSFTEEPRIITGVYRRVIPRERYYPLYNPPPQKTKTVQKQKPIEIQKPEPIQKPRPTVPSIPRFPDFRIPTKPRKPRVRVPKKRRRKQKDPFSDKFGWEKKTYSLPPLDFRVSKKKRKSPKKRKKKK